MTLPEAGKVASDAIDALKGSPALLALCLLQLMMLGILVYVARTNADDRQERELLLIRECLQQDSPEPKAD